MATTRATTVEERAAAGLPGGLARIAVATVYLQEPIEHFHQITLIGLLGGMGKIWLDPNRCRASEFGDPESCTEMDPAERRVRIVRNSVSDPNGRQLYAIRGALLNPLNLVVPSGGVEPFRFVYNDRGPTAPRPITLERLIWGDPGEPDAAGSQVGYCAANYTAQQFPDYTVMIAARGWHPTTGFKVFFEELPQFYPPEFKLLHIKPNGIALPVTIPFAAQAHVAAYNTIERVTVHDANGRHDLPVEQAREGTRG